MFSQRTNESFPEFRLKLYMSVLKLSLPSFAVSSYLQVGHRNLKCFLGTFFLWNTFTSPLFHQLHLDAREKKECCLFILKPSGFKICPCVSVHVYHWHLLTKLKNTALSDANCVQLCILIVKATVDSKIRSFLLFSVPESRSIVWC